MSRAPRPVLAVASECAPLVKTGGLADVVGALPAVLSAQGWAVRTLIPGYRKVMSALKRAKVIAEWSDLLGVEARIVSAKAEGLDLLVLDAPALFDREGSPYLDADGNDWRDNDLRFAALSLAAARIAGGALDGWRPELVHLHDWQAGLTPVYLRQGGLHIPCVMTIHNIAFHGLAPGERLSALGLTGAGFDLDGYEYYGHISALKAGLTGARAINTVSPTYAQELTTPEFGMGLDGVIRARWADVSGILNGIDTETWNPEADPLISPFKGPPGKAANTRALRTEFGLAASGGPLAVVVSRLSDQKGLDLLLDALPAFLEQGGQLALLGSGDRKLEHAFLAAADAHPGQVSVRIGYDEALSHRLYAGAEAVLVPSRFEPCGLTQMYGLRYGALPVVARTGGLADTVIHANAAALAAGCATGIVHDPQSVPALEEALRQLCALHAMPAVFRRLQKNAMKHPVGWEGSAPLYAALYARLADEAATETA
ncbi:glycogen synthase GlgA [Pararhodobacter sp. CCB-MM2]|uniref:glycogen synthase GlgA n=1 Tax=Pararhodobacter sp. CCB-MM2 TaxID=1786003 RepID=UPI000829C07B|nr:glycogen synthase GlgA [Pararhodobacter sp. CCB-MM2]